MTKGHDHKQKDDIASEVLEHLKNPPVEVINPNKSSSSNTKKYLIVAAVLIILGAGGFAAWKFLLSSDKQTTDQSEPEAESQSSAAEEASAGEPTQEYSSDRLLIDFKYPAGWEVEEDSGEVAVTSPEATVTDVNGEELSAEFKVFIKQGADQSDGEYLGRGFAIRKSQPFKYSDPAAAQREDSFITDFGLDASNNFAYFIAQGNFNLKKDETLGPDFASESDAVLVSGGFYSKDSEDETQLVSLDPEAYQSDETYLLALEIVKTLRLR
ncbi:MAG TPA: hypothetical protein VFX79_02620 [Candidatus Saccharimonadales bacterium]|nr:hypothetical protein [Candidatus Saccharimonadales bacterium]